MHRVTLIPGDGIGPSIADVAVKVIEAAGVDITWEVVEAGLPAIDKYKDPLPPVVLDSMRETRVALKGPLTTPIGSGFRSVNVALRKEFDLYANVRPARSFDGVPSRYRDIDLVIVRENTEEFYAGIEHYIDPARSAAETIGVVTRSGSERIIRYAYEYARAHGRKKVTTVHKANILKYTGGLFLEVSKKIGAEYPDIKTEDKIVDNMAMQMVLNPHQFDLIVTKGVEVRPRLTGSPSEGHLVESVEVTPSRVEIVGAQSEVQGISQVETEPIDLTNRQEGFETQVKISLKRPHAWPSTGQEQVGVRVAIVEKTIGRLIKEVSLKVENAKGPIRLDPPRVDILLEGPVSRVDSVQPDQVEASVVVPDKGPLPASLPVTIRLAVDGIRAKSSPEAVGVKSLPPRDSP